MPTQFIKYIAAFGLVELSLNLLSFASIVGTALTNTSSIASVAIVMALTTAASLNGFLIDKYIARQFNNHNNFLFIISASGILSTLLIIFYQNKAISLLILFLKISILFLSSSRLLACARYYSAPVSELKANKWLQFISSLSFLFSIALAPLIPYGNDLRGLYICEAILSILAIFVFVTILSVEFCESNQNQNIASHDITNSEEKKSLIFISLVVVLLFFALGPFHVFEVPFLKETLKATNYQISALFLLTGISQIITIPLLKEDYVAKHWEAFLISSCLTLLAASLVYIFSENIYLASICVAIIGSANSIFNVAKTTYLQLIPSVTKRSQSLILVKSLTHLGLLLSTLLFIWIKDLQTLKTPFTLTVLTTTALIAAIGLPFILRKSRINK